MAVLIIGAGLVGSQIARLLVEAGERPVLLDNAPQPGPLGEIVDLARVALVEGDVRRPITLARAIRAHAITEIVHLAANPMLTLGAQQDPYAAIELNVMGTLNVLETARALGIGRVVVASSNVLNHFLAGGGGAGDARKEEAYPRPTTFYATTKQTIENLGLNYARWADVDFAAVRYGAVAGPWSGRGGGGPSNVMRAAIRAALEGREATVPASGMEWVYSKDAARGTVLALRAPSLGSRVFNITMGRIVDGAALAEAIRVVVPGARVKIDMPQGTAVSMPDMQHASDLSLAGSVLGYAPEFDMPAAVRDLAAWLRAHPER